MRLELLHQLRWRTPLSVGALGLQDGKTGCAAIRKEGRMLPQLIPIDDDHNICLDPFGLIYRPPQPFHLRPPTVYCTPYTLLDLRSDATAKERKGGLVTSQSADDAVPVGSPTSTMFLLQAPSLPVQVCAMTQTSGRTGGAVYHGDDGNSCRSSVLELMASVRFARISD